MKNHVWSFNRIWHRLNVFTCLNYQRLSGSFAIGFLQELLWNVLLGLQAAWPPAILHGWHEILSLKIGSKILIQEGIIGKSYKKFNQNHPNSAENRNQRRTCQSQLETRRSIRLHNDFGLAIHAGQNGKLLQRSEDQVLVTQHFCNCVASLVIWVVLKMHIESC